MVGLVLVSHSRALAQATVDLIRRTVAADVPMRFAGGVGDNREELGTDGIDIFEAIDSVFSEEGVLVLMDMGSAILSAEMAKEFLEPDRQEKVRLSSAPLIEGAIAAAIQSQLGFSIEEISKAAQQSLLAKQEHLSENLPSAQAPQPAVSAPSSAVILDLPIENEHGLHLRPAAALIKSLARFHGAQIFVENRSNPSRRAVAKSLVDIARLQIRKGDLVRFTVSAHNAPEIVAEIKDLIKNRFGEKAYPERAGADPASSFPDETANDPGIHNPSVETSQSLSQEPETLLQIDDQSFPVSNGIAIGYPHFLGNADPAIPAYRLESFHQVEQEMKMLQSAVSKAAADFEKRVEHLAGKLSDEELAVFEAQRLIVLDPSLFESAEEGIKNSLLNAAAAWSETLTEQATRQESAEDQYLRERAEDFREVKRAVLSHLVGGDTLPETPFSEPTILVCDELSPTLAERCKRLGVVGVVQIRGGTYSHGAILARAFGLPAIGGSVLRTTALQAAHLIAIDGEKGKLWLDPDQTVVDQLKQELENQKTASARDLQESHLPAISSDNVTVIVSGNAGSAEDVIIARQSGADSIGLFRSEFLFQQFTAEPTEEQQIEAFIVAFGSREPALSLTVRLLDVGGDKPLAFLRGPHEANPFLGVRGIRLLLSNQRFFRTHLRALLRLSNDYPIRIMIPMVADISEVIRTRKLLDATHEELVCHNAPHTWPIPLGIMIETPAAAITASHLARHCDFFSLGTNDLVQYLLCAERGNAALAVLSDGLHPAVLNVCRQVAEAADRNKIDLSICGELASEAAALPFLLGIGIRSFSVNPAAIPRIKAMIRKKSVAKLVPQVKKVLAHACTASDVRSAIMEG
jgi:multiphosphoryl transfer protein